MSTRTFRSYRTTLSTLGQASSMMRKLEAAQTKRTLEMLATFLPDEVLLNQNTKSKSTGVGGILFISIMGVMKVMDKFFMTSDGGINKVSTILRCYIGSIAEVVMSYGGDIIGYTGGSFLVMWKVKPEQSMPETLHTIVECSIFLQENLSSYPTQLNTDVRMRCVVSGGNIQTNIIGSDDCRWFILAGDAMWDVKDCLKPTRAGEITVTRGAWAHMSHPLYKIVENKNLIKITKILYTENIAENPKSSEFYADCLRMVDTYRTILNTPHKWEGADREAQKLTKIIPLRYSIRLASKQWTVEDMMPFVHPLVFECVQEQQQIEHLGETLVVSLQFVHIILANKAELPAPFLHHLLQEMSKIVKRYLGIFISYSLFGIVLNVYVVYGLRGTNREVDSLNALRSGQKLKVAIMEVEEVKGVSIAVTNGSLFCGVIGHSYRKAYMIMGELLRKTRTLTVLFPRKVVCDYTTFQESKLASFYFTIMQEDLITRIKDYTHVFSYSEDVKGSVLPNLDFTLIGRENVYNYLHRLVYDPASVNPYLGICIHGKRTIGKTAVLKKFYNDLMKQDEFTLTYVDLISASTVPYNCILHIYRQLYDVISCIQHDNAFVLLNLPRDLWDPQDFMESEPVDVATQKYRILNYFRDITLFCVYPPIAFIDNIEFIDLQSWEILEIVLVDRRMKLFCTGNFKHRNWDLKFKISINDCIRLYELKPIKQNDLCQLICDLLQVEGISNELHTSIAATCEGNPGFIQSLLLRLIGNMQVILKYVNPHEENGYIYPRSPGRRTSVTVAMVASKRASICGVTMTGITKEVFLSFEKYQQVIIKTAAVLGDLFTRNLLSIALKQPSELTLAKSIKNLFECDIFDCGTRYVNQTQFSFNREICCMCYFERDYFEAPSRGKEPKYAYCRLIHFKNKSMQKLTYKSISEANRHELHTMCANELENTSSFCPMCIRNPAYRYITFLTFKGRVENMLSPVSLKSHTEAVTTLRDHSVKQCVQTLFTYRKDSLIIPQSPSIRLKSEAYCYCIQMFIQTCRDIIYHTKACAHLAKRVYYTVLCGLALVHLNDLNTAKRLFEKASELAMINAGMRYDPLTQKFRQFIIGRVRTGLARIALRLQKVDECKNHMAIALRQYNIPSLAFTFKNCRSLLLRPYVMKYKTTMKQYVNQENLLVRYDMAAALGFCAQLFLEEGEISMAKLAARYSICVYSTINVPFPILIDCYCTAIDIYRLCGDFQNCLKIEKSAAISLQNNYGGGLSCNLFNFYSLMKTSYEVKYASGNIPTAIRLAYRLIDMCNKMRCYQRLSERTVFSIVLLLIYNFRIIEVKCVLYKRYIYNESILPLRIEWCHIICLSFYLLTGLSIFPLPIILKSSTDYFNVHKSNYNHIETLTSLFLQLHYIRSENYAFAREYELTTSFDAKNVNQLSVLSLLLSVEIKCMLLLRSRRIKDTDTQQLSGEIRALLELAKTVTKKQYLIYYPSYLIYRAWFKKLMGKHKNSNCLLNEAWKVAVKQDNVFLQCQVLQLKNAWSGGLSHKYSSRQDISYKVGAFYSMQEWAQLMHAFPLE